MALGPMRACATRVELMLVKGIEKETMAENIQAGGGGVHVADTMIVTAHKGTAFNGSRTVALHCIGSIFHTL